MRRLIIGAVLALGLVAPAKQADILTTGTYVVTFCARKRVYSF